MSTSVDTAFVTQFEREVHEAFQRESSKLRETVRLKTSVVGSSTTFQVVGKGTATTKSRHGVITPMNASHTAVPCTVADFYAGEWIDKLDELKINIDERMPPTIRRVPTQSRSARSSATSSPAIAVIASA